MAIQSNINQIISLAGLLASQTPMASARREAAVEKQAHERKMKQIDKEIEAFTDSFDAMGRKPDVGIEKTIVERGRKAYQELFEAEPSKENLESWELMEQYARDIPTPEKKAEEAATAALKKEQERLQRDHIRAKITEGIYLTDSAFDPRKEAAK